MGAGNVSVTMAAVSPGLSRHPVTRLRGTECCEEAAPCHRCKRRLCHGDDDRGTYFPGCIPRLFIHAESWLLELGAPCVPGCY